MSEIVFNSPPQGIKSEDVLRSQIENLQTTLASLNQQVIVLQEALQKRDQKIAELQTKLSETTSGVGFDSQDVLLRSNEVKVKADDTLTIVGALINLYKFVLPHSQ